MSNGRAWAHIRMSPMLVLTLCGAETGMKEFAFTDPKHARAHYSDPNSFLYACQDCLETLAEVEKLQGRK